MPLRGISTYLCKNGSQLVARWQSNALNDVVQTERHLFKDYMMKAGNAKHIQYLYDVALGGILANGEASQSLFLQTQLSNMDTAVASGNR